MLPSCDVVFFGDKAGEAPLSSLRDALHTQKSTKGRACEVLVVAKASAADVGELSLGSSTWSAAAPTSVAVLVEASGVKQLLNSGRALGSLLGEGGAGTLGAAGAAAITSATATTSIRMVPAILEGLLIAFGLIFFAILGVSCVMTVRTPDVLHSFHLPAGKEY
jgi:hypothetical protein